MLLVMSSVMYAQDRVITGTVTAAEDGNPLAGVNVVLKGSTTGTITNINGYYSIKVAGTAPTLVFSMIGYVTEEIKVGSKAEINVAMEADVRQLEEVVVINKRKAEREKKAMSYAISRSEDMSGAAMMYEAESYPVHNTEEYDAIHENIFHGALKNPLSTFSIDVDAASYSNLRRFLNN